MSMIGAIRRRLTFANVVSVLALFVALTTGTAYAANEFTGDNIVDGSLTSFDIATNNLGSGTIKNGGVASIDILDNTVGAADMAANSISGANVTDNSLTGPDIADSSLSGADIFSGTITASDIDTGGVAAAEVLDFALTNNDVNIFYAVVGGSGAVSRSSGGVTATRVGTGDYAVTFQRDVVSCAFSATIGATGTAVVASGHATVATRSDSTRRVHVNTNSASGVDVDLPFHLTVVC